MMSGEYTRRVRCRDGENYLVMVVHTVPKWASVRELIFHGAIGGCCAADYLSEHRRQVAEGVSHLSI